ncbi:glycosyltransferase [Salinimicrobium sp. TH3]|uniref:glycosyltransferase n=1 Tax=Salinimicrobium sp. TH3 TaxID=2997342 RepID=UPI0022764BEC|nr:glycosyltransferase [Salinimicrobium sp. TH3]MCY2686961.1 glycosyltransferase [Salinimicrobium sp. TH3]
MSNKLKKVLFIIDTLQGSGAERSLVEIARNFEEYIPIFVHVYKGDMLKNDLEKSGIKVYSLNINKKYGFKEATQALTTIYKEEKPSLIHSTLFKSDIIARRMKKKFPEIPLMGSFVNNTYTPQRYQNQNLINKAKLWLAYQMDKQSARKVDFYISNSETIKKAEGGALGVPESKIEVIYRGRDLSKYEGFIDEEQKNSKKASLGLKTDNILLNVSRLIERKAQLDIINALPAVLEKYPDAILLIAGHGEYHKILENRAKALNIANHVKLLGRRLDVAELLELSRVFVYPSYAEGLPGALIEAMMAQKLIIASNIGENLECVDESSALIFQKGEVGELSNKIVYALGNFSSLRHYGENARKLAQAKFQIQTIAQKYEELYEEVINRGSSK